VDDSEQLRQWIQEKLEEGYSEERLKDIIEDRDLDPSVVDELSESDPDFQAFGERDQGTDTETGEVSGEESSPEDDNSIASLLSSSYIVPVLALAAVAAIVFGAAESDILGERTLDKDGSDDIPRGCSDVGDIGVRMSDVSRSVGATNTGVETIRGDTWITVEVYEDGELRSSERQYIEDSGEITVDAVGDRVVAHPVNCDLYRDSVEY
jgi:hypothetical protein